MAQQAGWSHGPAVIKRDRITGTVILKSWWKGDKLDRDDAPALIMRDPETGKVTYEAWYKDDKRDQSAARLSSTTTPRPAPPLVRNGGTATGWTAPRPCRHRAQHNRRNHREEWWKGGKPIRPPATLPQAVGSE